MKFVTERSLLAILSKHAVTLIETNLIDFQCLHTRKPILIDLIFAFDRLRVGWLNGEGVLREQTMLTGHLPRVVYHQAY
jgi:hypothetical protein